MWLLDQCPPDYRRYDAWRRHPVALAWLAVRHLDGQIVAMRQAYREIRVELAEDLDPGSLEQVIGHLEAEGLRLVAARRSAALLHEALRGVRFVPRL